MVEGGKPADQPRDGEAADGLSAVERAYGRVAPLYDLAFGLLLDPGRRALGKAVTALRPQTLLDVGVGSGLTLHRYPASTKVTGIDLSEEMLAHARRRAAQMPERSIELRQMNAEEMDFPDASFDCVTVPFTLSVTPNTARLVSELRRVCKPDGTILVVNYFSGGGGPVWTVIERAVRPLAARLGVKAGFDYDANVAAYDWQVVSKRPVASGLSLLVELSPAPGPRRVPAHASDDAAAAAVAHSSVSETAPEAARG